MRILVLSAQGSLARKMARNIRRMIERHPLTAHLMPRKADQWSNDRFTIKRNKELRDPSVLAAGVSSNITGNRADIIICDDVEVPGTCDSAEKREGLRERLAENEYILTPGGMQLYIGTPHTWDTIYASAPRPDLGQDEIFLKNYKRLCLPLLDGDGNSAWPERYTVEDIERIRTQTGPNKFASQMMLQPVNIAEGRLDPALLCRYGDRLVYKEVQKSASLHLGARKLVSCSAWWDPSFGSAGGDGSVLAVVYTDEEGEYWLHRLEYIRCDPNAQTDEATQQCQKVARILKGLFAPSVVVEINGIGKFLPAVLRRELGAANTPCAVLEVSNTRPKDLRILEAFDAALAARALHVHAGVYDTPFLQEILEWRPGLKGARDDGLDAVAGALLQEPVRLKRSYATSRPNWKRGGENHTAQTDFEV